MSFAIFDTEQEARDFEIAQDALHGLPLRGVHMGGGVHATMPATWDGNGSVPAGWTSYRESSVQHPTSGEWAAIVDTQTSTALNDQRQNRITGQQRAMMVQALAGAVAQLPEGWAPGPQGVAVVTGQGASLRPRS